MSCSPFHAWLQAVEDDDDADSRRRKADRFYEEKSGMGQIPLIEGPESVVFLYKGDGESVALMGDMTDWVDSIPLTRISGTNLFYLTRTFERDARLQYWFVRDEGGVLLDPGNPRRVGCGLGPMSELVMPDYPQQELFEDFADAVIPEFSFLDSYSIDSAYLGYSHLVHVSVPSSEEFSGPYPVIYFQDGLDYLRYAYALDVIEEGTRQKLIPPAIAVFVTPPNLHKDRVPNRSTEYGLNGDYMRFFCRELLPFIDERYDTIKEPVSRYIVGDSYGGLISTAIAMDAPELFAGVCSQSGYFSFQDNQLIKKIAGMDPNGVRLYFHVGTYERRVGASFIPKAEQDFTAANDRLQHVLEEGGWDFCYRKTHEGHTWGHWRGYLKEAMAYLFRTGDKR